MNIAEKITRAKADIDAVYEGGKAKAFSEVEPINSELEQILYGKDTGGRGFYDEFWDAFQQNGTRTNYEEGFAGIGWTSNTFKPKYDIKPKTAYMIFRDTNSVNARIDLVDLCDRLGINVDFSKTTNLRYGFYNSGFNHLGIIDLSAITNANDTTGAFNFCQAKTVDLLKLVATNGTYTSTFTDWAQLENITIAGTISCNGASFKQSTNLTKESITSIVNALSATTSGFTITLSKTAVATAFGSTESAEWNALISTKSNWTISLV